MASAANLEVVLRREAGRVFATLIRLLGDFDLAEEARQEAFAAALEQWPEQGMPANPSAWLIRADRNKAIDQIRRATTFRTKIVDLESATAEVAYIEDDDEAVFGDDRLRLIFTCCHPALNPEAQIALTLREVCGLTTQAVARAFLVSEETMAQRLVRAKRKIIEAGIPYETPDPTELDQRLEGVLAVVYGVFTEGYAATIGAELTDAELCDEAIRLGRLLDVLLANNAAVMGLLALMLLHDARRPARLSSAGNVVLLEHQDRALWNQDQIADGLALVDRSLTFEIIDASKSVRGRFIVPVELDGKQLNALIDTGAEASIVAADVAASLGVTQAALQAGPHAVLVGTGPQTATAYAHVFREIRIGDDVGLRPMLLVTERAEPNIDMILGADYLKNHHLWLSPYTKRVFVERTGAR